MKLTKDTTRIAADEPVPGLTTDELEDRLVYLDELRESGVTNMFGAGAYVENEFGDDRKTAKKVLMHWMDTFGERNP